MKAWWGGERHLRSNESFRICRYINWVQATPSQMSDERSFTLINLWPLSSEVWLCAGSPPRMRVLQCVCGGTLRRMNDTRALRSGLRNDAMQLKVRTQRERIRTARKWLRIDKSPVWECSNSSTDCVIHGVIFLKDWSRCSDKQSLSAAVKVEGEGGSEQGPPGRLWDLFSHIWMTVKLHCVLSQGMSEGSQ